MAVASAVAATSATSICGTLGQVRRRTRAVAIVKAATAAVGIDSSARWANSVCSRAAIRCSPLAMPSRFGRLCRAIRAAAPLVKPRNAAGEMKFASPPSRSAPISHCISPTTSVTPRASWM
jgi:hypothetical protein